LPVASSLYGREEEEEEARQERGEGRGERGDAKGRRTRSDPSSFSHRRSRASPLFAAVETETRISFPTSRVVNALPGRAAETTRKGHHTGIQTT
jgi:hypothetical protein